MPHWLKDVDPCLVLVQMCLFGMQSSLTMTYLNLDQEFRLIMTSFYEHKQILPVYSITNLDELFVNVCTLVAGINMPEHMRNLCVLFSMG